MQLSEHFTLEEFTFSQIAVRHGLDNTPAEQQIQHMQTLCENVLEPLRTLINHPLQISSGYRSPRVNTAVGGSPTSQHLEGKAADIVCPTIGTLALFKAIVSSEVVVDQLIFEGTWVHVSYDGPKNRQQILKATFKDGRATYTNLSRQSALALA